MQEKKKEVGCGGQLPTEDGIQLDIENCCNMTMCDTVIRVCYEKITYLLNPLPWLKYLLRIS